MVTKVQGLDRLKRQLAVIPQSVAEAAEAQMSANADTLAQAIKSHTPRRTGALEESVDFCAGDPPEGAGLGGDKHTPDPVGAALTERGLRYTVFAGNKKAFYARWVEFGRRAGTKGDITSDKSHRTRVVKQTHPGTKAQPFFYPTIRAQMPRLKRSLTRAINKAAKVAAATK